MAHVCYKVNNDVCHTAAILDAALGNVERFSSQLTTSSLFKLVHRAIFCRTIQCHQNMMPVRDVTVTCNHAYLGTRSTSKLFVCKLLDVKLRDHDDSYDVMMRPRRLKLSQANTG